MTNEERAALRALEVAATPGPWWYEYSTVDDLHWGPMGAHRLHRGQHTNYVANRSDSAEAADFALAAAARNALPRLLDLLDRCETALAGMLRQALNAPHLAYDDCEPPRLRDAHALLAELRATPDDETPT